MVRKRQSRVAQLYFDNPILRNAIITVSAFILLIGAMLSFALLTAAWRYIAASTCITAATILLFRVFFADSIAKNVANKVIATIEQATKQNKSDLTKILGDFSHKYPSTPEEFRDLFGSPSDHNLSADGVLKVYFGRREAIPDIIDGIKKADDRIWLLGFTLGADLGLIGNLPVLEDKVQHGLKHELRVLLANPLKSPSIFRMFLESPAKEAMQILEDYDRTKRSKKKLVQFERRLMTMPSMDEFRSLWGQISKSQCLRECIRFYAHLFSTWGAIIDDTAYIQQCFLSSDHTTYVNFAGLGAGEVFKIHRGDRPQLFEAIEHHFESLWFMTTTDMLDMAIQWNAERMHIIDRLFSLREVWLMEICRYRLRNSKGKWRRKSQRHLCTASSPPEYSLSAQDNPTPVIGLLHDYCFHGLGLLVESQHKTLFPEGIDINIKDFNNTGAGEIIADQVIPSTGMMVIAHCTAFNNNPKKSLLGLSQKFDT